MGRVDRRAFLQKGGCLIAAGSAGCTGRSDRSGPNTTKRKAVQTDSKTIFVDADAEIGGSGTAEDPKKLIQFALEEATPGDTVQVRPGRYTEGASTQRAGTPENPIRITGPPEAVYVAEYPFEINHSHVHVTGLTFDGLYKPVEPENPSSYGESIIQVNESFYEEIKNGSRSPVSVAEANYVQDVAIKPHAIGNCRADFIKVHWSKNIEIGEFKVIGPAGVKFLKGDEVGHNSEIIYLGNAPSKGWAPDLTRNIHIHHIDNSAGYPHAELVDCKTGTSNITIEYCTDAGGSAEAITDDGTESAVHIGGTDITVRWNIISGGAQAGIEIDSDIAATDNPPESYADGGTQNAIYQNQLLDNNGLALRFAYPDSQGQDAQRTICGNEYNGETHGNPTRGCPDGTPKGDGIGHTGGDSPWV